MAAPRPGADVRADTPEALAVEAPQVAEVAAADVPPEATSTEDAIESEAENSAGSEPDVDGDRRRRYRRWYRNIYPGPIPTPADWEPPEGPVHIALQAGHWKADEAPDELSGLKDNGTSARGVPEWRANLAIARSAASMLRAKGYIVDVLPAVVPPSYRAHLFISIHADGSNDPKATGFRVASPRRDATGRASEIQELLERTYGEETGIRRLPDSTRRMRNYYAFNFRRYRHALHPMTIAVILETGFLTSESDWSVIVDDPDRAARGIVEAVTAYHVTALPETPEVVAQQLD
jgi:N-acetylmuramoyl-L-alanine amidase